MSIRTALPSEAAALSALATRLFRETYQGQVPDSDIEAHVTTTLGVQALARELESPDRRVLVATQGECLRAYAQLRPHPCPISLPFPAPIEIARFYVDATLHGSGLAAELMAASLEWARTQGSGLWLQVWETNARAIRFYSRQGFADLGTTTYDVGTTRYLDRVMAQKVP